MHAFARRFRGLYDFVHMEHIGHNVRQWYKVHMKAIQKSRHSEKGMGKTTAKARMTLLLPENLIQDLKNAVYWTPADVTISDVATAALRRAVNILERRYNNTKPFEPRKADLRGGRPLK
jgi:hypothetical protein